MDRRLRCQDLCLRGRPIRQHLHGLRYPSQVVLSVPSPAQSDATDARAFQTRIHRWKSQGLRMILKCPCEVSPSRVGSCSDEL
jgi:hypothetical protein